MLNLLPAFFRRRAVAALTRCCLVFTLLCSLLLSGGSTVGAPVPTADSPAAIESHSLIRSSSADTPTTPAVARVAETLRSGPVMFIENVGQFADGARFQVRGGDGTIWLAEDAIWITVLEQTNPSPPPLPEAEGSTPFPGREGGRGVRSSWRQPQTDLPRRQPPSAPGALRPPGRARLLLPWQRPSQMAARRARLGWRALCGSLPRH